MYPKLAKRLRRSNLNQSIISRSVASFPSLIRGAKLSMDEYEAANARSRWTIGSAVRSAWVREQISLVEGILGLRNCRDSEELM